MATYFAVASGPISFLDGNQVQQEIPLSAVSFGSNGPDASKWPRYLANKAVIDALLQQMWQQKLLLPGIQVPTLALTVTAVNPIAAGNSIVVTFSNPAAATGSMNVTVLVTEVYAGLTPASLFGTLGGSPAPPGALLDLRSQAAGDPLPENGFTGVFTPPNYQLVVPEAASPSTTAFVLSSAVDHTYAVGAKVTWDAGASPHTFTLTVTATKTATGVTLATLEGAANPFASVVTFTGPSGGPLPAPTAVGLKAGTTTANVNSV